MKIEIPIEIFMMDGKGCHLFLEAEINGSKGLLILDTGASQTVLSQNAEEIKTAITPLDQEEYIDMVEGKTLGERFSEEELEEMGIDDSGVLSLAANGSSIDFQFGIINGLKIGDFVFDPFPVGTMDLTNVTLLYEKMDKKNVWGLLGSDLLLKYNAVINYKKKILKLTL